MPSFDDVKAKVDLQRYARTTSRAFFMERTMYYEFSDSFARMRHWEAVDEERGQQALEDAIERQLCEIREVIAKGDWSAEVWDTYEAKKVPLLGLFAQFLTEWKDGQEDTAKAIIRALAGNPAGLWQLTHEFFIWYEKECMK